MTASPTLQALTKAKAMGHADLLRELKVLKNSVIGNTWKKVEHAGDDGLLVFLLHLLEPPKRGDRDTVSIVCETAVILGALGSAGALTLRPMLAEHVPGHILDLIRSLDPESPDAARVLPPLLRALRNVLGATADAVWGHMWGVGTEQKVVGTGLVGDDVLRPARVRSRAASQLRADAALSLGLVFEPPNRQALLSLIDTHPDPAILLPLYQLLARLIALPSHRETFGTRSDEPYLMPTLLETVWDWWASENRPNPRLLEAALDLLAALVKGQPAIAASVRDWNPGGDMAHESSQEGSAGLTDMISLLVQLLETGPPGVRIAVASCLTNIIKADKALYARERVSLSLTNMNLLGVIIKLLRTEAVEERVKLCFILASLVSDDERLQKAAAEQACPSQLIGMLVEVDADETRGELGHEAAARSREAALLALASLSFNYEPTRSQIADAAPPVLPLVCSALSHPSYGVRAAACQLARALSRTVAILRTSLVDSGVGEEVVETLKREVARRQHDTEDGPVGARDWDVTAEEELGNRAWTVEVAATATICNLVTDFSPLKTKLISSGGIELLVELTSSTYEPLAENALWALKNVMYHASEGLKHDVMASLGWKNLRNFISPGTSPALRNQALEILQNLVDDQPAVDLGRTLDELGTDWLLDTLTTIISASVGTSRLGVSSSDEKLAIPSLYILSHIALGNERQRSAITTRVELLEALSQALNSRNDAIRVPALRTLKHLVESNSRSHRPRQAIVDLLQPYHLKMRVREIADNAPGVTVRQQAVALLDLLERARG